MPNDAISRILNFIVYLTDGMVAAHTPDRVPSTQCVCAKTTEMSKSISIYEKSFATAFMGFQAAIACYGCQMTLAAKTERATTTRIQLRRCNFQMKTKE